MMAKIFNLEVMIKMRMDTRNILANNIAYFRLKKGWTQEVFAEKLRTTITYLSSLENAKRNIRIDYIEHIANTLDISVEQLFIERPIIENHRMARTKR